MLFVHDYFCLFPAFLNGGAGDGGSHFPGGVANGMASKCRQFSKTFGGDVVEIFQIEFLLEFFPFLGEDVVMGQ